MIRVNDAAGNAKLDHIDNAIWHYHQDRTVDIALMRYELPEWSSLVSLPVTEFLNVEREKTWEIGPGDAVYLVGLFYLHKGRRRNLPVVHTGHIALMPSDEKIPVGEEDEEVEAYLVEVQGLSGASGSPVMVRPTLRHLVHELNEHGALDTDESFAISEGRDFLLGVWTAAWPGET